MNEIFRRIGDIGIVPVIKLERPELALPLGRALVAGGIPTAEITFRTAAAPEAIRVLSDELPDLLVGAGTVLTSTQLEEALQAGARFIVSPGFNPRIVDRCLELDIPVLPGVSGTEGIEQALERKLEVLKFFPAEAAGGVSMLEALAGPYQTLGFIPTGGINPGNLGGYARLPQVLAVGGSWMVKPELIGTGDWPGVEMLCREAVRALHGFAFAHVGLNGTDSTESGATTALLASLFGLSHREGSASFMLGDAIEVTKSPFPGTKGHLAIRCNNVERALAFLATKGIRARMDSGAREKGRLKSVYLELEVLGFALHLLKS